MNKTNEEIIWNKTKTILKPLEELKTEINKLYEQTCGYGDGVNVVIGKMEVERSVLDINYKLSRLENVMFKVIAGEEE